MCTDAVHHLKGYSKTAQDSSRWESGESDSQHNVIEFAVACISR